MPARLPDPRSWLEDAPRLREALDAAGWSAAIGGIVAAVTISNKRSVTVAVEIEEASSLTR